MSPKPPITFKEVKYRKIKSVDNCALVNYLAESSLCNVTPGSDMDIPSSRDLDTFAQNYNMTLSQVLDSHAPLKTKTIVVRPAVLRYHEEIDKAIDSCTEGRNANGGRPSWRRIFSGSKEGEIM